MMRLRGSKNLNGNLKIVSKSSSCISFGTQFLFVPKLADAVCSQNAVAVTEESIDVESSRYKSNELG